MWLLHACQDTPLIHSARGASPCVSAPRCLRVVALSAALLVSCSAKTPNSASKMWLPVAVTAAFWAGTIAYAPSATVRHATHQRTSAGEHARLSAEQRRLDHADSTERHQQQSKKASTGTLLPFFPTAATFDSGVLIDTPILRQYDVNSCFDRFCCSSPRQRRPGALRHVIVVSSLLMCGSVLLYHCACLVGFRLCSVVRTTA